MYLTISRTIISPGDLANYMDHCPWWLQPRDNTTNNWMDLDSKMTETIALVRAIGAKYFLIPDDAAMVERAEAVEKVLFSVMNSMVYLINKICFAPNNPEKFFDPVYANQRFSKKFVSFAKKLEPLLEGPFIMGDTLPIHADYLLYACLYDLRVFLPEPFQGSDYPKITDFMDKFYTYRSPIRRWFASEESKTGEYIRPPVPHIMTLLDR